MALRLSLHAYKKLESLDLRMLQIIEKNMAFYEYVPMEVICRRLRRDEKFVSRRLKFLNELGVVERLKGAYIGYILTSRGYDCLALNVLVKKRIVSNINLAPLGLGKESDVHLAISTSGDKIILKFHRLGRISFRQTRRFRDYVGERRHISWLYQSRLAAQKEYEALKILHSVKVSVPRPIFQNRHVVVMSYFSGIPLYKVPPLSDPLETLRIIIQNVRIAHLEAGVIHGDLSEYNVLVDVRNGSITIIDWPQWISSTHPLAYFYIKRDIENIIKFFRRKYKITMNLDEVLKDIVERGEGTAE